MPRQPWLDYAGQTTEELIGAKDDYSAASLACAFEEGIQAKVKAGAAITSEEGVVLAVQALQREVNNGGYHQFFVNSSRQFAPVIVQCLRRIDCPDAAAITERAITAVGGFTIDTEDPARDQLLDACDQEFYRLKGIDLNLFRFVEENQDRIRLERREVEPRRHVHPEWNPISALYTRLTFSKSRDLDVDAIRNLASDLAARNSIAATDAQIEIASVLYAFRCGTHAADFDKAGGLADRAFELSREEPIHGVLHRQWVVQLLAASKAEDADAETLRYLEFLAGSDQSTLRTQNRILFWAALLKEHRAELPRSVEFYQATFPEDDLDKKLLVQRFKAVNRPARK